MQFSQISECVCVCVCTLEQYVKAELQQIANYVKQYIKFLNVVY